MAKITVEQYFLLKNTLNIQLGIAWQKFSLLWSNKDSEKEIRESGVFHAVYGLSVAAREIEWLNERLMLLNKCYKEELSFKETVEKIDIYLLPSK